jgi:hypothetical protein
VLRVLSESGEQDAMDVWCRVGGHTPVAIGATVARLVADGYVTARCHCKADPLQPGTYVISHDGRMALAQSAASSGPERGR